MDIAIRAEGLGKTYQLYDRPIDRLLEFVTKRPRHTAFPALQGVSFEIPRGESIGLIGQNGAGKSTLLKLLANVTQASEGSLETNGTVASILELGTGFHPDFTGRDNAALNAAILGLKPAEVKEKLPAILEFSELGGFLDQAVKTYSTGMYMRLAFSVAVNVDPDILIIDEALAVGDGYFQKKCIDRIREIQSRGRTVFFCSHALYYVSTICSRAIWLDRGTIRRFGPSVDVVHEYETFLLEQDRQHLESETPVEVADANGLAEITDLAVRDSRDRGVSEIEMGDDVVVALRVSSSVPETPLHVIVAIRRAADDTQCFAVSTRADEKPLVGQREYDVAVRFRDVRLLRGDYSVTAGVVDAGGTMLDRKELRPAFSVGGERYDIGLISVAHSWEVDRAGAVVGQ